MISQYAIEEEELLQIVKSLRGPYALFPSRLYSGKDLYDRYEVGHPASIEDCYDQIVYRDYIAKGKRTHDIRENLARVLHDHSISDALNLFLSRYKEADVVGVMGGHRLLRTDSTYREIVMISKMLTERGKLMISGGGPGAMEATHLGAWMAGRNEAEVNAALAMLQQAPSYADEKWLDTAMLVMQIWPQPQNGYKSVGIPTWLYGHEPATPFATHIAKYFDNSIREDGILTLAFGGIVYAPGSAGTVQEIFQDATQNHYLSYDYGSPMIFLGSKFWTDQMPIYPFLRKMLDEGKYKHLLLSLHDKAEDIVEEVMRFKPAVPEKE